MDYVKPADVVASMIDTGARKGALPVRDLLIRGALSGAILGIATALAITTAVQTNTLIAGAIIFPVGFVMIVLLGLELVTGSFALLPMAQMDGAIGWSETIRNWAWVFVGNLVGSLVFAFLMWGVLTMFGEVPGGPLADRVVALTQAKTLAYAAHGGAGWATAFAKGVLCNWMVCMGVVMGMVSTSTLAKIVAAWLPITIFFGLGYEHAVVNMFLIPAGMLLGAKVTTADWWLWNQIPVTLGNLVGGFCFTGLAIYSTYKPAGEPVRIASRASVPAE